MPSANGLTVAFRYDNSAFIESMARARDRLADLDQMYALAVRMERMHALKARYNQHRRRRNRRG